MVVWSNKPMKVGLIDVDSHSGFPNLALMKLSAWHKAHGDSVEWYQPLFTTEPLDIVYMSKVFTFTPDYPYVINAKEIVGGGYWLQELHRPTRRDRVHVSGLFYISECGLCGWVPHKRVRQKMPVVRCAEKRGMDSCCEHMAEHQTP